MWLQYYGTQIILECMLETEIIFHFNLYRIMAMKIAFHKNFIEQYDQRIGR